MNYREIVEADIPALSVFAAAKDARA